MGTEVENKNRNCVYNGPYIGRDFRVFCVDYTTQDIC